MEKHSDYKKNTSGECHFGDYCFCRKGHKCNWCTRIAKKYRKRKIRLTSLEHGKDVYMQENDDLCIPVNDTDKCLGCKFWLYFKNENRERCSIKGCWNNSKYVPYIVGNRCKPN